MLPFTFLFLPYLPSLSTFALLPLSSLLYSLPHTFAPMPINPCLFLSISHSCFFPFLLFSLLPLPLVPPIPFPCLLFPLSFLPYLLLEERTKAEMRRAGGKTGRCRPEGEPPVLRDPSAITHVTEWTAGGAYNEEQRSADLLPRGTPIDLRRHRPLLGSFRCSRSRTSCKRC